MLKIIVFIFGSAGFSWLRGLFPLVVVSGGRSLVVLRLPTAMASLVSERRLQGAQASVAAARGLSNCDWATGLSCSTVYGIFPDRELNPHLLH